DDPVAGPPAGDRLGQGDLPVAGPGGVVELDPGTGQGSAVEVHAAAAADDGRAGLFVHPLDIGQPDEGGVPGRDGLFGGAGLEGELHLARLDQGDVSITIEAVLAGVVARLDLDQADAQPGVAVAGEGERPGNVDRADHRIGLDVVKDRVPRADLDPGAGGGDL